MIREGDSKKVIVIFYEPKASYRPIVKIKADDVYQYQEARLTQDLF
jgi:hypothetical protein